MIADRYLEQQFRAGFIVGYKVGFKEGFKQGYAEGFKQGLAERRDEFCRCIRQILDHPPAELTPEMRDGLMRVLAELEKAPVPEYGRGGCCRPRI